MKTPLDRAIEVTGCDMNLAKRLATLFLPNCKNIDRTIRTHFFKHQHDELAAAVHKLKSGLAMFGTEEVAKQCETLEQSARNGDRDQMETLLNPFLESLDSVKRSLEEVLEPCPAN